MHVPSTLHLGAVSLEWGPFFIVAVFTALLILGTRESARVNNVFTLIKIAITLFVIVVGFTYMDVRNFTPFVPLAAAYAPDPGTWNTAGWTLVLGGMFIAAWSTYGFETAVCYTSEFKNPETDTFKAIFYSGLLCMVLFILVPITIQGYLGVKGMLDPGVVAGTGVASVTAVVAGKQYTGTIMTGKLLPLPVWIVSYPLNDPATLVFRDAAGAQIAELPVQANPQP